MNTGLATLNLCQQDAVFLQTAQASVETLDGTRSKYLKILFHTGSQVSLSRQEPKVY